MHLLGALAFQSVQDDQLIHGRHGALREAATQMSARPLHSVIQFFPAHAEFLKKGFPGDRHLVCGISREGICQHFHAKVKNLESFLLHRCPQRRKSRVFFRRQQRLDQIHQFPFLHPAPGKGIQPYHCLDHGESAEVIAPIRFLQFLLEHRAGWSRLIQEQYHWLADP